jgi:hypothetical protein
MLPLFFFLFFQGEYQSPGGLPFLINFLMRGFIKNFNEEHYSTERPILSLKEKKEKKGKHRVKGQKTRVKKFFWGSKGREVQQHFLGPKGREVQQHFFGARRVPGSKKNFLGSEGREVQKFFLVSSSGFTKKNLTSSFGLSPYASPFFLSFLSGRVSVPWSSGVPH